MTLKSIKNITVNLCPVVKALVLNLQHVILWSMFVLVLASQSLQELYAQTMLGQVE